MQKKYIHIFCFMLLHGMPHLKCKTHWIWILTYSRLQLENAWEWLSNTCLSNSRKKNQPGVTQAILRRHKFHKKSLLKNKRYWSWEKHSWLFSLKCFSEVLSGRNFLRSMHVTTNICLIGILLEIYHRGGCCLFAKTLSRLTWKTLCTSYWILRLKILKKILGKYYKT